MKSPTETCAVMEPAGVGQSPSGNPMAAGVRKILVPISPSSSSVDALTLALALSRNRKAEIVLLQAVELNILGEERGVARARLLRELQEAAEASLIALGHSLCGGAPFRVIVAEGPPAEVILRTARTLAVDVIVMGPRSTRRFRWLRRNNLKNVLREAACSVYAVAARPEFTMAIPALGAARSNNPYPRGAASAAP